MLHDHARRRRSRDSAEREAARLPVHGRHRRVGGDLPVRRPGRTRRPDARQRPGRCAGRRPRPEPMDDAGAPASTDAAANAPTPRRRRRRSRDRLDKNETPPEKLVAREGAAAEGAGGRGVMPAQRRRHPRRHRRRALAGARRDDSSGATAAAPAAPATVAADRPTPGIPTEPRGDGLRDPGGRLQRPRRGRSHRQAPRPARATRRIS